MSGGGSGTRGPLLERFLDRAFVDAVRAFDAGVRVVPRAGFRGRPLLAPLARAAAAFLRVVALPLLRPSATAAGFFRRAMVPPVVSERVVLYPATQTRELSYGTDC